MTTATTRDLPGAASGVQRLLTWMGVVAGVGAAAAFWARHNAATDAGGPLVAAVVPVVTAVAVLLVWFAVHRRRGREPRVEALEPVAAPPTSHSPAAVGWLLRYGITTSDDVAATLLDLAARKAVALDTEHRRFRRVPDAPLQHAGEGTLLAWLFPGEDHVVSVDQRSADITADPRSWQQFHAEFGRVVTEADRVEGLVERTAATEEVMSVGLLSATVIVGGAIGMARGHLLYLACIGAGAAVLVFADTLARRSQQGAVVAAQWRAFCQWLSAAPPEDVRRHLPHAAALGMIPRHVALTDEQRLVIEAVQQWERAYRTASAFLSGPTAVLRVRRRRQVPEPFSSSAPHHGRSGG